MDLMQIFIFLFVVIQWNKKLFCIDVYGKSRTWSRDLEVIYFMVPMGQIYFDHWNVLLIDLNLKRWIQFHLIKVFIECLLHIKYIAIGVGGSIKK